MVPIISSIFPDLTIQTAVACSLGVISFNSLMNLYNFRKIKLRPNLKLVFSIGIPTIIGAFSGSLFVNTLPRKTVIIIFAITIILSATKILFFTPPAKNELNWENKFTKKMAIQMSLIGLFAGFVSALTGLGGGAIVVPLLVFISVPLMWLPVYSNSSMLFGTTTGWITQALSTGPDLSSHFKMLSMLQVGNVNFLIILGIITGSVISSRIGTKLTKKVDTKTKKKIFAVLFLIILVKIFLFS